MLRRVRLTPGLVPAAATDRRAHRMGIEAVDAPSMSREHEFSIAREKAATIRDRRH